MRTVKAANKIKTGLHEAIAVAQGEKTGAIMHHKNLLSDEQKETAKMLRNEIGKVRCWLTGFRAGRGSNLSLPGEDSLRQVQIFLSLLACQANNEE